jgi:hypothetical protein
MGLGMLGPASKDHPVLGGLDESIVEQIDAGLVVTKSFDNNWEAFNGSILIGRYLLYGDDPAAVLPHFEKIAAKYDETGYFDDTAGLGNYNNYGLMSLNYPLRAAEFLPPDHEVRRAIEARYRPHALRYVDLVLTMTGPRGDAWPFGRSAGALGQLQCVALVEQCLSKGWIPADQVGLARQTARLATSRMIDLYWDETRGWFSFRDDFQTAYNYRASLPMAWDLVRYFLQLESYAAQDETEGIAADFVTDSRGERCVEIVTNERLRTAIHVWSSGDDHAVTPVMAGPHEITGDSLARPYAPGLFEWTTQTPTPALCPRVVIGGTGYWPSWHAISTRVDSRDGRCTYAASFRPLYSDAGEPCEHDLSCDVLFVFSTGRFERIDTWSTGGGVEIDEYRMEVLQPARHPHRPRAGEPPRLTVSFSSDHPDIRLGEPIDVSKDPAYRSYHAHANEAWIISGERFRVNEGEFQTVLVVEW